MGFAKALNPSYGHCRFQTSLDIRAAFVMRSESAIARKAARQADVAEYLSDLETGNRIRLALLRSTAIQATSAHHQAQQGAAHSALPLVSVRAC
jgi:hypothetical protein